ESGLPIPLANDGTRWLALTHHLITHTFHPFVTGATSVAWPSQRRHGKILAAEASHQIRPISSGTGANGSVSARTHATDDAGKAARKPAGYPAPNSRLLLVPRTPHPAPGRYGPPPRLIEAPSPPTSSIFPRVFRPAPPTAQNVSHPSLMISPRR